MLAVKFGILFHLLFLSAGEKTGMSVPNNVRKVMNVQLVLRTHKYAKASDKDLAKKVTILDNEGLEWMDNEVKMLRVMKMNGRELTAFGRSQLLESWTKVLKQCVSGEGLQPSGSSDSVTASPPSLELTEEKEKTVCSPSLRRPNPSAPAKSDAPVPEPGKEKEQGLQDLEKPEDVPLPEDEAISPSEESPVKPENHKLPSEPATPESVSDKPSESVDNVLEPSSVAPAVKETEDLQKPEVVEAESTEILDVPATARKSASPQEEFHEAEDGGVR